MKDTKALHVSLEEFGLSEYEAKAYVALVVGGTGTAAEIAYRAGIVRTKVYPTMDRLGQKGLVVVSNSMPRAYTPVAPEDAFDGIIQEQISRIDAMNALVASLKRLNDESRRQRGAQEKRYVDLAAASALGHLGKMIDGAKRHIHAMVGHDGAVLLAECRPSLLLAAKRGVPVRIVIPPGAVGTVQYKAVADCGEVRVSDAVNGCVMFDDAEAMFVGGAGGGAAVLAATGAVGAGQSGLFARVWDSAARTDGLADMTGKEAQEVYAMVGAVEGGSVLGSVLGGALGGGAAPAGGADVLGAVEKAGIDLAGRSMGDMVEIVDAALRVACSGHAVLDGRAGSISVKSALNGGHCLPWVAILVGWLSREGYATRTTYKGHEGEDGGETAYVKFTRD